MTTDTSLARMSASFPVAVIATATARPIAILAPGLGTVGVRVVRRVAAVLLRATRDRQVHHVEVVVEHLGITHAAAGPVGVDAHLIAHFAFVDLADEMVELIAVERRTAVMVLVECVTGEGLEFAEVFL